METWPGLPGGKFVAVIVPDGSVAIAGTQSSMRRIGMKLRGLRQARQRRGISISQLAESTGLRRDTISHLEHGQEDPQPYVVRRLQAALGASTAELCGAPGASLTEYPAEMGANTPYERTPAGVR